MNNRWLDKCIEKQTFIIEEWKLCRGLLPSKALYVALYLGDKLMAETIWDEETIRFRPYEEQIEYLKERGFNHE